MTEDAFDLVVIGGGAAGLTAAGTAAQLGAKTALVEARALGGDCTWRGCIPSKTLLHAAHTAAQARTGAPGVAATVEIDGAAVLDHVRRLRAEVYSEADSPERLEPFGVEVIHGFARFTDPHTLRIALTDGGKTAAERPGPPPPTGAYRTISADRVIVATGSAPVVPDLPGLADVPFLTNETVFELTDLPAHLLVLGGGPIGCELAQAFRRLGSQVTLVEPKRLLSHDDPELVAVLTDALRTDGIDLRLGVKATAVSADTTGVRLTLSDGSSVDGTHLLVAVGRKAVTGGLGLDRIGLAADPSTGLSVDQHGRTSIGRIYAIGDVAQKLKFTHVAEATAKVAVSHALFGLPMAFDPGAVPWATFTDPELAHLGPTEAELTERGVRFDIHRFPFSRIDRATTDGRPLGLMKVLATPWTGEILGAHIVGPAAGELIHTFAVAKKAGLRLPQLADTIFVYPTLALGTRRAADQWAISSLRRPSVQLALRLAARLARLTGTVKPPPDGVV